MVIFINKLGKKHVNVIPEISHAHAVTLRVTDTHHFTFDEFSHLLHFAETFLAFKNRIAERLSQMTEWLIVLKICK